MLDGHTAWPTALLIAALYCVNQWLAVRGISAPTNLAVLLILMAVVLASLSPSLGKLFPALFLVSLLGFPEYSADPYAADYIAPFSFAKVPALLSLFLMGRPRLNRHGLAFVILIIIATAAASGAGRLGDVSAEIWYVALAVLAMNSASPRELAGATQWILAVLERVFYLLIPLALFTRVMGMYDERAGDSVVYFYGHWVGLSTAVALYASTAGTSAVFGSARIRFPILIATICLCMASYQSAHFLLYFAVVVLAMKETRRPGPHRKIQSIWIPMAALALMLLTGTIILARGETDSWLYLKISQIFLLFSGGFVEASNSVTIRVSQLISMFEQGSPWTILFGRGAFSTYQADGAFWDIVVFHSATFPERELLSGDLQYIHETPVMVLKWIGLVGLTIFCLGMLRLRSSPYLDKSLAAMIALFFLLFFTSSLQTGMLVTALVMLSTPHQRHAATSNRHLLLG